MFWCLFLAWPSGMGKADGGEIDALAVILV